MICFSIIVLSRFQNKEKDKVLRIGNISQYIQAFDVWIGFEYLLHTTTRRQIVQYQRHPYLGSFDAGFSEANIRVITYVFKQFVMFYFLFFYKNTLIFENKRHNTEGS